MKKILSEKYCTGCSACSVLCRAHAIAMVENDEGFLFPKIDSNLCIDCKQCIKVCPVIASLKEKSDNCINKVPATLYGKLYAARNHNMQIVMQSASGGFFHAIASVILESKGVVYGVSFDKVFLPQYVRAETASELQPMLSSKYVEAFLSENVLNQFFDDIRAKKIVLFVGTPCRVAGIISMCDKFNLDINNVYFADFFTCAGVPSRKLWTKKLAEQVNVSTIKNIDFRYKEKSYRNYSVRFTFKNDSHKPLMSLSKLNDWGRLFLFIPHCLRRSCRYCVFLTKKRKTDFYLGDMWDSSYIPHKWQDDKGVSLVMINTVKARNLLDKVYQFAGLIELDEKAGDWAGLDRENNYIENLEDRKKFWSFFMEHGFTKTVQRYCPIHLKDYIKFGFIRPILIKTGLIKYIDKIVYRK